MLARSGPLPTGDYAYELKWDGFVRALCVVDVPGGLPNVYVHLWAAPDGKPTADNVQAAGEVLTEAGMAMHENPDTWVGVAISSWPVV